MRARLRCIWRCVMDILESTGADLNGTSPAAIRAANRKA